MKGSILITSIFSIIILLLCLVFPSTVLAQWEMADGIEGGRITSIVGDDSVLLVACENHTIYSNESGTWEEVHESSEYSELSMSGNCVFLTTSSSYGPCKRSFDYGNNWELVSNLSAHYGLMCCDSVIFFTLQNGLMRSYDNGDTYENVTIPIQQVQLDIRTDKNVLYIHAWDGWELHKIYYSDDDGSSWDSLSTDGLFTEPETIVKQIKVLNGSYWCVTEVLFTGWYLSQLLFVFDENQKIWNRVSDSLPTRISFQDIIEYNGNILCSYSWNHVFLYNSQTISWSPYSNCTKSVNQFIPHKGELYCATDQGPCVLNSDGSWTTSYSGIQHRNISSIDTYDDRIYVTANNELFESDDWGSSFAVIDSIYGHQIVTTDSVFYMLSKYDFWMSWDQGETWQSFTEGINLVYGQIFVHFTITPKYYYLGTNRGLFKSSSTSIFWNLLENEHFSSHFFCENVEAIDNTVMAGQSYMTYQLYLSKNYGYSFDEFRSYRRFTKIGLEYYILGDTILYSVDEGNNWIYISHNDYGYRHCIDRKGDSLVVGGAENGYSQGGVQISYNFGEDWDDITDNLPSSYSELYKPIEVVKIVGSRLFSSCMFNGLWYRDDIFVSISNNDLSDMNIIAYPNPVNDILHIDFSQDLNDKADISVYSTDGSLLRKIEIHRAANIESLDVSSLKPGVYFVRIEIATQSILKKIVKM